MYNCLGPEVAAGAICSARIRQPTYKSLLNTSNSQISATQLSGQECSSEDSILMVLDVIEAVVSAQVM